MSGHKHVYTSGTPQNVDTSTLPSRIQEGITIAYGLLNEDKATEIKSHLCIMKDNGDHRVLVFKRAEDLDDFLVGIAELLKKRGTYPIAEVMLISEAWLANLMPPHAINDHKAATKWVISERDRLNELYGSMKDWPADTREECVAICYLTRTTMWMAQVPFSRGKDNVMMHLERVSAFECEDTFGTTSLRLRALIPLTKKEHHGAQGPSDVRPEAP